MDFGLNSAVVKYVAEYNASENWKELQKVINISITLFLSIGLFCSAFLLGFSFFYERFFQVAEQYITYGRYFILITGIELGLSFLYLPIKGALNGLQRADVFKKINILSTVIKLPLAITFFNFFDPAKAFLFYLIIDGIILNIIYLYGLQQLFKICPHYKFIFMYFNKRTFHKMFKFSVFIFLGGLASLVIFQTDNIVIAAFLNMELVTYYSVAIALSSQMRNINGILGGPIFLAVAHLAGLNDETKNRFMLFKGTKLMNAIYAPIILITVIFCEVFILNWLGPEFSRSILPARLLLFFWLFNGHMETASGFLTSRGHVDIIFYIHLGNAVSNIVLSLILIKYLGIVGVALGTFIPMVIFCTINLIVCLKKLQISLIDFVKNAFLKNFIFYLIPTFLALATVNNIKFDNIYLTIVAMGMIFAISELLYFFFFLDKEERSLIFRIAKINL
jgi:O-antigen/teichoic acid export membrane protein